MIEMGKTEILDGAGKIPALRVVLCSNCSFSCEYCPPNGENFFTVKKSISTKELLFILEVFYKLGFRQFGFTGGDPLLRKDFSNIISACKNYKQLKLKLYTNGVLVKRNIHHLRGIDLLKIGLDTLDKEKFRFITGNDNYKDVLEGIEAGRNSNIKVRVNTVLTKRNASEIFDLISFCLKNMLDLKILDLNCFDSPGYDLWRFLYESPVKIIKTLDTMALPKHYIKTVGSYGIPMPEYYYNGISVRIKDTHKETTFAPVCYRCPYFPCQEGIYHLTLTVDGRLKMCRHRDDIFADLVGKNSREVEENIKAFLERYYYPTQCVFVKKQVFQGCFGKVRNMRSVREKERYAKLS